MSTNDTSSVIFGEKYAWLNSVIIMSDSQKTQ